MRTAALTLLFFVAFMNAAKAQKLSLVPQVGFENSKTRVLYNEQYSFAPSGLVFTPQAALQLNYRMRSGHGFFLGAATSRSTVSFNFADPETGMNNYKASIGNMQVRMEGGYQFSSKPIFFKKSSHVKSKTASTGLSGKKSCGANAYRSYCTKAKPGEGRPAPAEKTKPASGRGGWVKLQPSAGLGLIPGTMTDVMTRTSNGQVTHVYNAGNWNTALLTGMNFEFGKNSTRLITIGFNYIRGIGNLNTQTISSVVGSKTLTTRLSSEVSGWNMRIGLPLTLGAKKPIEKKQPATKVQNKRPGCSQYKIMYRCSKSL